MLQGDTKLHMAPHGSCTWHHMAAAHGATWQLHMAPHGSCTWHHMAVAHGATWQLHMVPHGSCTWHHTDTTAATMWCMTWWWCTVPQTLATEAHLLRSALSVISGIEIHKGRVGVDPGVVVTLTLRHKHPARPCMSPHCIVFRSPKHTPEAERNSTHRSTQSS